MKTLSVNEFVNALLIHAFVPALASCHILYNSHHANFEVLTVVLKVQVFWEVTSMWYNISEDWNLQFSPCYRTIIQA
jgi:hypothetical protein